MCYNFLKANIYYYKSSKSCLDVSHIDVTFFQKKETLLSRKDHQHLHNSQQMSRISISAVSWAWLLPRRGRSGRRLDFYGKHHASSSKMSAAWWLPNQVESASKTNFYIRPKPVNHKVPLRGTCNVQFMDQAANLSEVLAWSYSLKSVLRTANICDVSPDT